MKGRTPTAGGRQAFLSPGQALMTVYKEVYRTCVFRLTRKNV